MTSTPRIEWMPAARKAAARLKATTARAPRVSHFVYVILLRDAPGPRRLEPRWGLYVGETSRDPDLRFDQHKSGYKASRWAERFGVELLPDLVQHLNPLARWEAVDLEAALAEAFRAAGVPWVEGGH